MAEEGKGSSVLKWVGIGCGVILLLVGGSCVGIYFLGKHAVNKAAAEGKSFAAKIQVAAVEMMKPSVVSLLPVADHPAANKAFNDLSAKATMITDADSRELQQAMQEFSQDSAAAGTDMNARAAAAKKFAAAIQAVADKH